MNQKESLDETKHFIRFVFVKSGASSTWLDCGLYITTFLILSNRVILSEYYVNRTELWYNTHSSIMSTNFSYSQS